MMSTGKPSPRHSELECHPPTEPDVILDELWGQGKRPDLRDFLAPWLDRGLELGDLLAVLRVDQRRRWFSGQRVDVSDYQTLFPMLGDESEALFELVYHELLIREEIGDSPDPREYAGAFPEFDTRLKLQIEVHQAFSLDEAPQLSTEDVGALAEPDGQMPSLPGYTLLGEIGRGGMGVVYRARQHKPSRAVALKMILDGRFASKQDLLRFQNETEAVAGLDYPNIVPILEVGQHDRLHYFSMRLLTGGNLAEAQSRLANNPRAVAQLLEEIAGAVHHAHQRGVLHRDLKPANILLDDEGHAHVTDFGLAKRVCVHSDLTGIGAVLGSPGYMAPEQAMGDLAKVTTATDVYGLGAILYSLFTGRPPFEAVSAEETIYRLCNELPEPPTSLNRAVPRPLEVICLKCLEKDPSRRYSSVAAVADDLRRWQAGEPIIARPVRTPVRAWLWIRRHPSQAVLAGALLCTLISGFACMFTLWLQAEKTNKDLKLANAALTAAQAREQDALTCAQDGLALSLDALLSAFAGKTREDLLLQIPEAKSLRIKRLKDAVSLHERLETALKGDSSPKLLVEFAESYAQLGAMATEVGSTDIALSAYNRAVQIRRNLSSQYPSDYQRRIDVAELLARRAEVERKLEHQADALESLRHRAAIYDELVRGRPDDEQLLNRQMWSHANVAAQLRKQDKPIEALLLQEQVLSQRQEVVRRFPNDFQHRAEWAFCMAEVGLLQSTIPERLGDAVASLEKARDELESLHRAHSRHTSAAWWLTQCLHGLSKAYKTSSAMNSSLQAAERASDVVAGLVTAFPGSAKYRERQARINSDLSNLQTTLGYPAGAAEARAVASLDYLVRAYPGVDRYRADLVRALVRQTALARDVAEFALAESSARQAVEHAEQIASSAKGDANIARAADCHLHLAVVLLDRGRRAEAEAQIGAAVTTSARLKQPDPKVLYDMACARAMLNGITTTGSERDALAGAAMVALRHSMDSGYRDVFDIQKDNELTARRPRRDFPLILYDLDFPADPFAH
jgi:eukaryotic-like serine/threonine-protein kinase